MRKLILILFVAGLIFILSGIYLSQSSNPRSEVKSSQEKISLQSPQGSSIQNVQKEEVLITKVVDGDTIETSNGEKIRYIGINAPEKDEPFANESKILNQELVLNKKVQLEFDVQTKDRFGRILAYLFTNQTMINLELVKVGLAVSETFPPNIKYQNQILEAQKQARDSCLGIWKSLCSQNQASQSCIKITTINYDAPGNDNLNKNGEWIKFKNSCSQTISMTNWFLKDTSASNKYTFKNFSLLGSSEVNLYSGCGQDSQTQLYWQCPERKYAVWNNSGDHAFLYNDKGELVSDYQY